MDLNRFAKSFEALAKATNECANNMIRALRLINENYNKDEKHTE